jgi:hypothetical protein
METIMSLLEKIHTGKKQQAPRLLIYGTEGSGKSTIASQASKPIFVLTEDGTDQIDCHSFTPILQGSYAGRRAYCFTTKARSSRSVLLP